MNCFKPMKLEVKNLIGKRKKKKQSWDICLYFFSHRRILAGVDFSVLQLQACLVLLCSLRPVPAYSSPLTLHPFSQHPSQVLSFWFLLPPPSAPSMLYHHFPLSLCPSFSLHCSWLLFPCPENPRSCCPALHPDSLSNFHLPQPSICSALGRAAETRQIKVSPVKNYFLAPYVKEISAKHIQTWAFSKLCNITKIYVMKTTKHTVMKQRPYFQS